MFRFANILIIICALLAPGLSRADPGGTAIAEYFGAAERVRYGMEQMIPRIAETNPDAAEAVRKSMKYMKREEVIAQSASVFERGMSPADIKAFQVFMATPLGQRLGQTFRNNLSPESADKAMAAYPKADMPELNRFFSSRAAASALAALNGANWNKTWEEYGEVLACRYYEHEEPKLLAILREKGKCLAAPPAQSATQPRAAQSPDAAR